MTLAPRDEATADVRSVEPLSTTMISSTNSGMARSTCSMPCSSLRHGMMTVIDWPLYIRRSRVRGHPDFRAAWSVDCYDETYAVFWPFPIMRRQLGRRDGERSRSYGRA